MCGGQLQPDSPSPSAQSAQASAAAAMAAAAAEVEEEEEEAAESAPPQLNPAASKQAQRKAELAAKKVRTPLAPSSQAPRFTGF